MIIGENKLILACIGLLIELQVFIVQIQIQNFSYLHREY